VKAARPFDLSRRELLAAGVALGLARCASEKTAPAPSADLADPLYFSSVTSLASAIRAKSISSEEAVRACVSRIEEVNGKLNAVVQLAADEALARAREADEALARGETRGPLHGVPMTIKDSLDTRGVVTTGGTSGRASFVPEEDATVVKRVKDAGAILLGKTNTPELTLSFETTNLIYGRTNNPYDLARTSGGSSGGATAIVAAGGAPFDIGSDYGGSIRLPCHFCGIAGIKPTMGRVPRTGHIYPFGGLLDSAQQIGPIARTVDDLALLLPILSGPDGIDPAIVPMPLSDPNGIALPTLKVAFHTDNGILTPTAETQEVVRKAASALSEAGAVVEEARPSGIEESFDLAMSLYFADGGAAVRRLLQRWGTTEHTLSGMTEVPPASAEELDVLIDRWYSLRSRMSGFLLDYDAILCPVNAGPAMLHEAVGAAESFPAFSYTMTFNLTGWPGAVVRCGTSPEGLPIGVQVVARPAREDVALALVKQLESALGGFAPPPAI
jgi:amidase